MRVDVVNPSVVQAEPSAEEDARGVLRAWLHLHGASGAASPYTSEAPPAGIPPESMVLCPSYLDRIRFNTRLAHASINPGRLITRVGDFQVDEDRFSYEVGVPFGIESAGQGLASNDGRPQESSQQGKEYRSA